jgi:hypothetical protein
VLIFIELRHQVTWRSKVEIDLTCEVFQVTTS